jgi:hypothetical protein
LGIPFQEIFDSNEISNGKKDAIHTMIFPKLINIPNFDVDFITNMQTMVSNGGRFIITHPCDENLALLNVLFGFGVEQSNDWKNSSRIESANYEAKQFMIDEFLDGPLNVPRDTNVCGLKLNSLPSTAQSIYGDKDFSAVTVFGYGSGVVITLAFDWIVNAPENWKHVLDLSIGFTTRPASEFYVKIDVTNLSGVVVLYDDSETLATDKDGITTFENTIYQQGEGFDIYIIDQLKHKVNHTNSYYYYSPTPKTHSSIIQILLAASTKY